MKEEIRETVEALEKVSAEQIHCGAHTCPPPDRQEIVKVIHELQALLFPMAFRREYPDMADETLLSRALYRLRDQASRSACRRSNGSCFWTWKPCMRAIPPPSAGKRS